MGDDKRGTRGSLRLLLCGDTILRTKMGGDPFLYVHDIFHAHDIILLNLETPLVSENFKSDEKREKSVVFHTDPTKLDFIKKYSNKLIFSLANNHILDFGVEGYRQTILNLEKFDCRYISINSIYECEIFGVKLRFISFYMNLVDNFGEAQFLCDSEKTYNRLKGMKDGYLTILPVHWGEEHLLFPSPRQQRQAKEWIDAGVDIVVGAHSHTVQGVCKKKRSLTIYSLGNFNMITHFNRKPNIENKLGYMVSVQIEVLENIPIIKRFERIAYLIDENWAPVPIDEDLHEGVKKYILELDNFLGATQEEKLLSWVRYLSHSSFPNVWCNLLDGWGPRIRKYGAKHFFQMIYWLFCIRTLIHIIFVVFWPFNLAYKTLRKLRSGFYFSENRGE